MSKITIRNLNNKEVSSLNNSQTLLNIIQENGIDWMHACGGKGRCTTCKVRVLAGIDAFSEFTKFEAKLIQLKILGTNERLACQCSIHGNIIVEVPNENKLPHLSYSY